MAHTDALDLLRRMTTASLAVTDAETGGPYVSLVNLAVDRGDRPLLLLSQLARHTKALLRDNRAAVLIHDTPNVGADPLTAMRFTLLGRCNLIDDAEARQCYVDRHPHAAGYVGFADFGMWCLEPEQVHMVAGFGRIQTMDWATFRKG